MPGWRDAELEPRGRGSGETPGWSSEGGAPERPQAWSPEGGTWRDPGLEPKGRVWAADPHRCRLLTAAGVFSAMVAAANVHTYTHT